MPPGVMPMLVTTLVPAKARSTTPHGMGPPTAWNDNARQITSSIQFRADSAAAATHVRMDGRTPVSEPSESRTRLVASQIHWPSRPRRCPSIQSNDRISSSGRRKRIAAPTEPASTTDRIGSRTGAAPPPAMTAPVSATAARAAKAIAPEASSLQAATAELAPNRRYLAEGIALGEGHAHRDRKG